MSAPRTSRIRRLAAALAGLTMLATAASPVRAALADQVAGSSPPAAQGVGPMASDEDFRTAAAATDTDGMVDVVVGLRAPFSPEGDLAPGRIRAQRDRIARQGQQLLDGLRGTRFEVIHTYDTVPMVALRLSRPALEALRSSREAASVAVDVPEELDLATSTQLVQAVAARQSGRTGAGQYVAVLDTGVDKDHPFLAGKVKQEACFSATSSCPNGQKSQLGSGAAAPCSFDLCWHGTHVAGIATGKGPEFSGVAPDASLIAIAMTHKVCKDACYAATSGPSHQIKALEHVYKLRQDHGLPVAAVNMSFGSGIAAGSCDTSVRKPIIDNLRSVGVASVAATGNDFINDGIQAPACISTAIAVGSTEGNQIADLSVHDQSNSSDTVDLLAPNSALSSMPGGEFGFSGGTSMAAPHVAGAFAVMRQVAPSATVTQIEGHLESTGIPVKDLDNGVTKPFLQLMDASVQLKPHLSVSDVTVPEGDFGTKDAVFTITRQGLVAPKITADFATMDGTAMAPADYLATNGTVTLQPGQKSTTVTVKVKGDLLDEANEQFGLKLSNVTGASTSVADSLGVATITDDEKPVSDPEYEVGEVTIDDIRVVEGDSRTTQATFTLSLAKPLSNFASVDVETPYIILDLPAEWAEPGTDYVYKSETIAFQVGETSKTFTVTVHGDTTVEATELFVASLSNPSHLTITKAIGRGLIINDD